MQLLSLLKKGGADKDKLIINDRADIALFANIHRVQLPSRSFSVKQVRSRFPHLHIGRSVHSLKEAIQAEKEDADYVVFGHVFETECKQGLEARGISLLSEIKRTLSIPVIAIGGMTMQTIGHTKQAKPDGIAVMSGIFSAENPKEAAKRYARAVREADYEEAL